MSTYKERKAAAKPVTTLAGKALKQRIQSVAARMRREGFNIPKDYAKQLKILSVQSGKAGTRFIEDKIAAISTYQPFRDYKTKQRQPYMAKGTEGLEVVRMAKAFNKRQAGLRSGNLKQYAQGGVENPYVSAREYKIDVGRLNPYDVDKTTGKINRKKYSFENVKKTVENLEKNYKQKAKQSAALARSNLYQSLSVLPYDLYSEITILLDNIPIANIIKAMKENKALAAEIYASDQVRIMGGYGSQAEGLAIWEFLRKCGVSETDISRLMNMRM